MYQCDSTVVTTAKTTTTTATTTKPVTLSSSKATDYSRRTEPTTTESTWIDPTTTTKANAGTMDVIDVSTWIHSMSTVVVVGEDRFRLCRHDVRLPVMGWWWILLEQCRFDDIFLQENVSFLFDSWYICCDWCIEKARNTKWLIELTLDVLFSSTLRRFESSLFDMGQQQPVYDQPCFYGRQMPEVLSNVQQLIIHCLISTFWKCVGGNPEYTTVNFIFSLVYPFKKDAVSI